MNVERVNEIIRECCVQLRKCAPVVEHEPKNDVQVTEVYAMPHVDEASDDLERVDVHFFVVGVNKEAAGAHREELASLLAEWPGDRLKSGPSYIESGGELGDQGAALCLYGLGQTLGFWDVITPGKLGMTGEIADQMAGGGFVMNSGFNANGSGQ